MIMAKRTKKVLGLILSLTMILSLMPTVLAEDEIKITYNGEIIETDTPPVIVDGRTLVPARAVFEAMDCLVEWYEEYQNVVVLGRATIYLTIGSDVMDKLDI